MVVHVVRGDGLSGVSAAQMGKVREVATSPTRAVVFWDDNIGANPRYAKELFRALAPLKKWWTSQCTANAVREAANSREARASSLVLSWAARSYADDAAS